MDIAINPTGCYVHVNMALPNKTYYCTECKGDVSVKVNSKTGEKYFAHRNTLCRCGILIIESQYNSLN